MVGEAEHSVEAALGMAEDVHSEIREIVDCDGIMNRCYRCSELVVRYTS